jgi:hypothetical protein
MKLTTEELEKLIRNVCTETPLYKKLQEELYKSKQKEVRRLYKEKIKISKKVFETVYNMFSFKELDLYDSRSEAYELAGEIYAIENIEILSGSEAVDWMRLIIHVNVNELKDGEMDKIVRFKNKNDGVFIKIIN